MALRLLKLRDWDRFVQHWKDLKEDLKNWDMLVNGFRVMRVCIKEMDFAERNVDGKRLEFCDEKELCVANNNNNNNNNNNLFTCIARVT